MEQWRPVQVAAEAAERNQRLNNLMMSLRKAHPEWPAERIRAVANRLLDRYTGPLR